jgi:hypothetical protein
MTEAEPPAKTPGIGASAVAVASIDATVGLERTDADGDGADAVDVASIADTVGFFIAAALGSGFVAVAVAVIDVVFGD